MATSKPTLYEQYIASQLAQRPYWRTSVGFRWTAITLSIIAASLCMPQVAVLLTGTPPIPTPTVGFRWNGPPVVAERTFSVLKPEQLYAEECARARDSAPPVYLYDFQPYKQSNPIITAFRQWLAKNGSLRNKQAALSIVRWIDSTLTSVIPVDTLVPTAARFALLRSPTDNYRTIPIPLLLYRETLRLQFSQFLSEQQIPDSLRRDLITHIAAATVAHYSPEWSQIEKDYAVAQVRRTYGIVRRGETIVASGQTVTPTIAASLASYRTVLTQEHSTQNSLRGILSALVRALLLSSVVWLYLIVARWKDYGDNRIVVTVAALLVISTIQSFLSTIISDSIAPEFLVLLPAWTMLVTVLFDIRLAFVYAMSAALLHIAIRSSDIASGLSLLVASIAGALSIQALSSRYQFFRAILFVALGFGGSLLIAVLESEIQASVLTAPLLSSAANAIVSPLLVYGILALIDRSFDFPTDLRLLELDDLRHPLLVKMRQLAPGTYQHTLTVAMLAEHAALAIGANPLLARVGAYFHDIGKIRKPEYFAENQFDSTNKHRQLSPKQSAAIIRAHVEEGVELALEYKLPPKIIEFIPMHHGTSLIRHFYALAVEESQAAGSTVDESNFRYPGPKPRTKETGIVMLADIAEAVARTAESTTQLEDRLEFVFREKILDGQLDECPLSLSEIITIRRAFLDLLIGALHQRPEYKEPPIQLDSDEHHYATLSRENQTSTDPQRQS
ncbi:MAG: HDIG domain-containing protein [Chlorobi bacterium]|nr:HDIG domain-containing protein [Chlorobiota bacterium]